MAQLSSVGSTIEKLQGQIDAINSYISIPIFINNESISVSTNNERASDLVDGEISLTNPTFITKFEKLPDPPIFNEIRKNLRSFVIRLYLKLSINQDRYPTEDSKINYKISRLDGDVARTIYPFFRNRILLRSRTSSPS